jgi:hypothetical protein
MALTAAQKKKFFKIRKEQGADAAEAFRTQVTGGAEVTPGAPPGAPPSIDLSSPQSVINAQGVMNDRTVTQSTPNVTNDFGSRTITTDPVTGQKTVTEGTTGANKALMEQGQANQGMINTEFQKQMGYAGEQGKFDPRKGQTAQNAFDPSNMGQLPQYQDPRAGLNQLPSWEDPRKTQVQAPGSFRDMQQQTYQNALQDYTSSVREDQSFRRDALEQQMANEGIPRDSVKYQRAMAQFEKAADQGINQATRAAYRDSMDVGSQAFQNQLSGQGQEFDQNFRSGDQRFNQSYNARGQAFGENRATGQDQFDRAYNARAQDAGFQAQQFGQQSGLNDRAERMASSEYRTPYEIANSLSQGKFEKPDMGPTQSINAPTADMLGYGTSYLNRQQQDAQFRAQQKQQMEIARMNNATAQSSGGSRLGDTIAAQNNAAKLQMENFYAQQGYTAGQGGPQQPGWGDVAGNAMGGVVSGIGNGIINRR